MYRERLCCMQSTGLSLCLPDPPPPGIMSSTPHRFPSTMRGKNACRTHGVQVAQEPAQRRLVCILSTQTRRMITQFQDLCCRQTIIHHEGQSRHSMHMRCQQLPSRHHLKAATRCSIMFNHLQESWFLCAHSKKATHTLDCKYKSSKINLTKSNLCLSLISSHA